MNAHWKDTARATLEGSENDTLTFPEGVRMLTDAGFDGYAVDFRRSTRTYYMSDGETIELDTERPSAPVAAHFDATLVKQAIREAQAMTPGYTYKAFCAKAAKAGCAGYVVSLLGKRVLYYGRSGETHTEYFPAAGAAPKP